MCAMRPRVVFVEDDASVRRFVGMALEDLDIDLVECSCAAQALQALAGGGVRLILTDLMMPGESGLELLDRLSRDPSLRGEARIAVFSAVADQAVRDQLERLVVWRILPKPASLAALEACVRDALADADAASPPPLAAAEAQVTDESDAIARHFEGNAALYTAFKRACCAQFPLDARAGDEACVAGDAESLRRIAHSLKTVLHSLGHPALGVLAQEVEQRAAGGELAAAARQWIPLRDGLHRLAATAQ